MRDVKQFLRGAVLGCLLFAAPVIVVPMVVQSCALYNSDPVGTTLLTMKDSYEASIRTAGRLYAQGLITEPQLRQVRDQGNKFYAGYQAAVAANEQRKLEPSDARLVNLRASLDALEKIVVALSTVKK